MNPESILEIRKLLSLWLLNYMPNERGCAKVMEELEETILIYLRIMNDLKRSDPDVKTYLSGISERERVLEEFKAIMAKSFTPETDHPEKD